MRVLLAEDHGTIAAAITALLQRRSYAVTAVTNGPSALQKLREDRYDIAILDLGLPGLDGFEICRAARKERIDIPILILTVRDSIEDRVQGLDAGADDYLIKPFHEDELSARLRTLTRRSALPIRDELVRGEITLDRSACQVRSAKGLISLTATEFRILELLMVNAGMTLKREQILDRIWGTAFDGDANIIDVYISGVRRAFRALQVPLPVSTVRGLGYRFDA